MGNNDKRCRNCVNWKDLINCLSDEPQNQDENDFCEDFIILTKRNCPHPSYERIKDQNGHEFCGQCWLVFE
jgi:hypothetical protein